MWQRVLPDQKTRSIGFLFLLIIVAAIPLTVLLSRQEQDNRQRAAGAVCSELGTDTVLVIDKSNSMNEPTSPTDNATRLVRAKEAAKRFADLIAQKNASLPSDKKHKISVVTFSNSALTTTDVPLTSDMNLVKSEIDGITPGNDQTGWTCIECGVKVGNAQFSTSAQRPNLKNVTILLTDGKANWLDGGTRQVGQAEAEQKAREAVMSGFNQQKIMYFTIGLGTQQEINEIFLKDLAQKTGASYYYSPTASDLSGIYSAISQVISNATVSGFVYHDINNNGKYDADEELQANRTINLKNSTTGQVVTKKTDTQGEYTFTDVCDGGYSLSQELPNEWEQVSPPNNSPYLFSVDNSTNVPNKNFGNRLKARPSKVSLRIFLHGIGQSGDNANPDNHSLSNKNPLHTQRTATIEILDIFGTSLLTRTGNLNYNSTTGNFIGEIELDETITTGNYLVKVRFPTSLRKQLPTAITLTKEQTTTLPITHLVTGDVNSDNKLDILDYNLIIGCYSDFNAPLACTSSQKEATDVTDDGKVNQFDYNLFLRDLSVQFGD